ncbi:class I SAM-dependent methyltransferase [Paenibacillus chibensis]|uniref:class I SAM-dependent methyltransferase n=1 Tax=Paenibacillus chibensis TaxID=59846 RepID=UPI001FE5AD4F|nr:class I SAM-dependent methyltransferase [Paenibacillus chibensis]MEC0371481.1 class I SAM-dependent methyltransferase [Paenibacillus chibensis]
MHMKRNPDTIGTAHEEEQKQLWENLWGRGVSYRWDALSELVLNALLETTGPVRDKKILEAGSGTGKISLRLAMEGAEVTLVDYAQQALEQSRLAFRMKNRTAEFVQADIRSIPAEDNRYDLCWNAGVLEHFSNEEKIRIMQELARITKPGGSIIVLVPYSCCLPYRIGKAYAEQAGSWPYGVEMPVTSLKDPFTAAGLRLIDERGIGFLQSLEFLDFMPGLGLWKEWLRGWYDELDTDEQRHFPGYLLLAHGRKS